MVLIISQSHSEYSTDDVIDWLSYYDQSFIRLNGIDYLRSPQIKLGFNKKNTILGDLPLEEVKVVWFRRWTSAEDRSYLMLNLRDFKPYLLQLNEFLRGEYNILTDYLLSVLKNKVYGKILRDDINKLLVLRKAVELGINIPETAVISLRSEFEEFVKNGEVITKPIGNGKGIDFSKNTYVPYTAKCNTLNKAVGSKFAPSLFQKHINKKHEIRTFYLNGKFFSMAIFSQSNAQTSVDFRRYDNNKPNRTIPFQLPLSFERKLKKLAMFFGLKLGSFDIIRTPDDKYCLLEINPEGQFGMVSYPCNYFLEKEIALELIKANEK
ncbi:MAG: grasp-with-spasm system ATP-grasp peptide maturase [Bacteroidota bacterium]